MTNRTESEEIIRRAWQEGQLRAAEKRSGIGNVWEGPTVDALASVFAQMERMGIGRLGADRLSSGA